MSRWTIQISSGQTLDEILRAFAEKKPVYFATIRGTSFYGVVTGIQRLPEQPESLLLDIVAEDFGGLWKILFDHERGEGEGMFIPERFKRFFLL